MSEANFYFGRINFKHQISSLDLFADGGDLPERKELVKEILLEYVRSDGPVYHQNAEEAWYFGDVRKNSGYIYGKFGKVFPENPTTYDKETGDFIEREETDQQADYSMFIIVPEKNIIIYNQRKRVGFQQFREAFAKGYNNFVGKEDSLSVNLLQNKTDVERIIQNARVSEAEFDLVPTNPTTDPDMKKLDSHLQNMEASNLTMTVDAPGSLNMDADLLSGGIAMTNNGYGEYRLTYEQDDKTNILTSEDKPAVKRMEQPENLSEMEDRCGPELIDFAMELTAYDE